MLTQWPISDFLYFTFYRNENGWLLPDRFKPNIGINLFLVICHNIFALPDWQHSNPAVQPISWLCSQPSEVSDSGENPRWVPDRHLKRTLISSCSLCAVSHISISLMWRQIRLGKGGWLSGLVGKGMVCTFLTAPSQVSCQVKAKWNFSVLPRRQFLFTW